MPSPLAELRMKPPKTGIVGTSQQHDRGDLNQGAIVIANLTSYVAGIVVLCIAIGIWSYTGWETGTCYRQRYWWKVSWFALPTKLGYIVLGWATIWSAGGIIETIQHTGGGMVSQSIGGHQSEDGWESYGEEEVWADEWDYKKQTGGGYSMVFLFAIYVWSMIVKRENDEKLSKSI